MRRRPTSRKCLSSAHPAREKSEETVQINALPGVAKQPAVQERSLRDEGRRRRRGGETFARAHLIRSLAEDARERSEVLGNPRKRVVWRRQGARRARRPK